MSVTESNQGPAYYEYLRAFRKGTSVNGAFECDLFTDAYLVGGEAQIGPYKFINPVAMHHEPGYFRPALLLRCASMPVEFRVSSMERTEVSHYHGGTFLDEVAALLSLCLDIRFQAGKMNRVFDGTDPQGKPIAWELEPWPPRKTITGQLRLPWAVEPRELGDASLELMDRVDRLTSAEASALIKAARNYQEALWISEWEPERAWLALVSAIEAVDDFGPPSSMTDAQVLEKYNPEIATQIKESGGEELLVELAPLLRPLLASTRKFCDFITQYFPDPPTRRPPSGLAITWTVQSVEPMLKKIYSHRSKALHDGTPFPMPMCMPPVSLPEHYAPMEMPIGLASSTRGGTWVHTDTPMNLHIFAHLVRGSIMKWANSHTS